MPKVSEDIASFQSDLKALNAEVKAAFELKRLTAEEIATVAKNPEMKWFHDKFVEMADFISLMADGMEGMAARLMSLATELEKRQGQPRNNERNQEILRLHRAGKTGGQIAKAIAGRWKTTPAAIRAVIGRSNENSEEKRS